MMDKEYRRGRVVNAPLVYVFAMIRIQEIKSYAKYIDDLQEALRDQLPSYHKQDSNDRNITINLDGTVSTLNSTNVNFYFSTFENNKGIMIRDDRIVLHSTSYTRFDDFRAFFEPIVNTIKEKMKISYYRGAGIRYVDHVRPIGKTEIKDIVSDVRFLPKIFGKPSETANQQCQTEIFNTTAHGNLIVRGTYLNKQPPVHPAILNSFSVLADDKPVDYTLVIDTDHADGEMQKLKKFNVAEVFDHIRDLHETCHNVFEETVDIEILEKANDDN